MRSLNLTLAVGLVASASAVPGPANRVSRRGALGEDLNDSVAHITVNVSAHIVKTSDDKYLSVSFVAQFSRTSFSEQG